MYNYREATRREQSTEDQERGPAADDYATMNAVTLGQQPQYEQLQLDQRRNDSARYANIHWHVGLQ